MDKIIDYILKRIADGVSADDLAAELVIIKRLVKHIPSYNMEEAMNASRLPISRLRLSVTEK